MKTTCTIIVVEFFVDDPNCLPMGCAGGKTVNQYRSECGGVGSDGGDATFQAG